MSPSSADWVETCLKTIVTVRPITRATTIAMRENPNPDSAFVACIETAGLSLLLNAEGCMLILFTINRSPLQWLIINI
jgi:hypothetical protein